MGGAHGEHHYAKTPARTKAQAGMVIRSQIGRTDCQHFSFSTRQSVTATGLPAVGQGEPRGWKMCNTREQQTKPPAPTPRATVSQGDTVTSFQGHVTGCKDLGRLYHTPSLRPANEAFSAKLVGHTDGIVGARSRIHTYSLHIVLASPSQISKLRSPSPHARLELMVARTCRGRNGLAACINAFCVRC